MTLDEFLLARITEDEADAKIQRDTKAYFQQIKWGYFDADFGDWLPSSYGEHTGVGLPHRVLVECEAKRRIVAQAALWDGLCAEDDWPEGDMSGAPLSDAGRWLLRALALPYADHDDYEEAWRL